MSLLRSVTRSVTRPVMRSLFGNEIPSSPFIIGVTKENTAVIRAAINAVRAGTGDALWLSPGDSIVAGGVDAGAPLGLRATSRPHYEAIRFATRLAGVTVEERTLCATSGKTTTGAYETMVPQYNFVSGTIGTGTTVGGRLWQHALTTGADVYTPGGTFNKVRLRYSGPTTGRSIVWSASTGAGGTIVGDSNFNPKTIILDMAGNATTLSLRAGAGGAVNWHIIECYNDTSKRLAVYNGGWNGADSIDWSSVASASGPIGMTTHLAAHMADMQIGTNDCNDSTVIATFKTNVQAWLTAQFAGGGNAALWSLPPLDPALYTNQAHIDSYNTALMELAVTNGIPYIDLFNFLGGYTNSVAQGWTYGPDGTHLTPLGADKASELSDLFMSIIMAY